MAITAARLAEAVWVTNAAAAVITNPAATRTYVQQIILHNTHTAAIEVQIWIVPDAGGAVGVAADQNKKYHLSIAADDTVTFDFGKPGIVLTDTNDTIQMQAGTTNLVNVNAYGFQQT